MEYLELDPVEHLLILNKLKKENKEQIVVHEVNIKMGEWKVKKAKEEDDKIKEEDKKEDFGVKAVSIKMKLEDFKLDCKDLYDGLKFINKEIDEISKAAKDEKE